MQPKAIECQTWLQKRQEGKMGLLILVRKQELKNLFTFSSYACSCHTTKKDV